MAHTTAGSSFESDPQQQRSGVSDHEFIARMRAELYKRPSMRLVADRVTHIMLAGRIDRDDPILELIESDDILDEKTVLSDAVERILSFPHLSAKEVADDYDKNWANPSDALRKLSAKGEVIGLKRAGKFRYPEFQFSLPGEANQVVREGNVLSVPGTIRGGRVVVALAEPVDRRPQIPGPTARRGIVHRRARVAASRDRRRPCLTAHHRLGDRARRVAHRGNHALAHPLRRPNRGALTLNPTPAGAAGGRFDSADGSYHYSYFGEDISTCIAETYCRSLPLDDHLPRILRKAKLAGRVLSQVTVTDDVPVALVHGSHLAAIGQDTWLTKCDPVDYRTTRDWAAAILHGTDGVLGIKYRARNDEDKFSVVMAIKPNAGVGLPDLMTVSRGPIVLDDRAGLELVRSHLAKYNATLI